MLWTPCAVMVARCLDSKMAIRTYTELCKLSHFRDRFEYLKLDGNVGKETFGFDRYFNQVFYHSAEWKRIRNHVIARDNGCDLGVEGFEIYGKVYIHHMNPILLKDIQDRSDILLDPEYLITTTFETHNAIHYGDADQLAIAPVVRSPNDTTPWKH